MVPSMYCFMCDAELVTEPSPKTSNPHFEATIGYPWSALKYSELIQQQFLTY